MSAAGKRTFHAHETARVDSLNGAPLAMYWQRLFANWIDVLVAITLWGPAEFLWRLYVLHQRDFHMEFDYHQPGNILVMLLYWGLATYFSNGKTMGKWIMRIRVVSLTSERLGLWQSLERALGYGAAMLELGLGFLQFFWDRNRQCAQDRLAETIVIDERKKSRPLA